MFIDDDGQILIFQTVGPGSFQKSKNIFTLVGTRTQNLQIRSLTRYPLRHKSTYSTGKNKIIHTTGHAHRIILGYEQIRNHTGHSIGLSTITSASLCETARFPNSCAAGSNFAATEGLVDTIKSPTTFQFDNLYTSAEP